MDWRIERIIGFGPGDFYKDGFVHFGFHDGEGRLYVLDHQKHLLGLVGKGNQLEWTVAARTVFEGVPNIRAELEFPIYIDAMRDGAKSVVAIPQSLIMWEVRVSCDSLLGYGE